MVEGDGDDESFLVVHKGLKPKETRRVQRPI